MINILKKIGKFFISKPFLIGLAVFFLILLCVLFWVYSPLIAFNDIHIFGNAFLRGFIIFAVWFALFLIFALKKVKDLFVFFTNENKQKLKIIKNEAKDHAKKTKRNFLISLKEAKQTWKNNLKIHNMPIVLVVGDEGAGKSSFINYADIEYPVTETLGSYKKHHMSTRNFSLYISKNGALVDTEGNFFSQESLFKPQNTDEMPEDDVEKNKIYLTKRIIWRSFLKLLNKFRFYKRLNGVILVIDLPAVLLKTQQEITASTAHMVQRISELETYLNLQLPVYIILNKIDLLDGMDSFLKLYNEKVSSKVLGITFPKKIKITEEYIDNEFGKIISSLKFSLMNKNHHTQTVQDKKKAYFYVAQLETLSKLVSQVLNKFNYENSLKNKSFLRGVYFTCSYQENVPSNILFEGLSLHYKISKPMLTGRSKSVHQSFFVSSLLKDIIIIPILSIATAFSVPLALPFLIIELGSAFINLQCINLQEHSIAEYESCKPILQKQAEKERKKRNTEYTDGKKLIGNLTLNQQNIPTIEEIIKSIKTPQQAAQIRDWAKSVQQKQNKSDVKTMKK